MAPVTALILSPVFCGRYTLLGFCTDILYLAKHDPLPCTQEIRNHPSQKAICDHMYYSTNTLRSSLISSFPSPDPSKDFLQSHMSPCLRRILLNTLFSLYSYISNNTLVSLLVANKLTTLLTCSDQTKCMY